jgi:hypothetical protein
VKKRFQSLPFKCNLQRYIVVVVGHPIPCPKTAEPTQAQIDEYHHRYVTALKDLYDTHRRLFHKLKRWGLYKLNPV